MLTVSRHTVYDMRSFVPRGAVGLSDPRVVPSVIGRWGVPTPSWTPHHTPKINFLDTHSEKISVGLFSIRHRKETGVEMFTLMRKCVQFVQQLRFRFWVYTEGQHTEYGQRTAPSAGSASVSRGSCHMPDAEAGAHADKRYTRRVRLPDPAL